MTEKVCTRCGREPPGLYVPPEYMDGHRVRDGNWREAMCYECYREENTRRYKASWSVSRSAARVIEAEKTLELASVHLAEAQRELRLAVSYDVPKDAA